MDDVNRSELASAGMDVGTPNDDPESPSLQGWGRLPPTPFHLRQQVRHGDLADNLPLDDQID
jgi:hypothetical protein